MSCLIVKVFLLTLLKDSVLTASDPFSSYINLKRKLVQKDSNIYNCHNMNLTDHEEKVDKIMLDLKQKESSTKYSFSDNFLSLKKQIDSSELRNLIGQMPKGALLHVYDTSLHSPDYLMNITYSFDNLYLCMSRNVPLFRFSMYYPSPPGPECNTTQWFLLKDLRKQNSSHIDETLVKHFSVFRNDNVTKLLSRSIINSRIKDQLEFILPLITYIGVWKTYLTDALRNFLADGIIYVEFRTTLLPLYGLEEDKYTPFDCAKVYKEVIRAFKDDNPDFVGAKIIFTPKVINDDQEMTEQLILIESIKKAFPGLVAGFGLNMHDHSDVSLDKFAKSLSNMTELNFFFQAGETRLDDVADENLINAVALNAKRINNGFALAKYPNLCQYIKSQNISIEVSVISDQIFYLVKNLRQHPLAYFLAQGLDVILSGNRYNLWGASPLSDDYYLAWIAVSNFNAGIKLLKQFGFQSIYHSNLKKRARRRALYVFKRKWRNFIYSVILYVKKNRQKDNLKP